MKAIFLCCIAESCAFGVTMGMLLFVHSWPYVVLALYNGVMVVVLAEYVLRRCRAVDALGIFRAPGILPPLGHLHPKEHL